MDEQSHPVEAELDDNALDAAAGGGFSHSPIVPLNTSGAVTSDSKTHDGGFNVF